MTAQVGNKFRYKEREYSIVAQSERLNKPSLINYGIIPKDTCTACYAGFWYSYNITDEGLFLEDIHVNSARGKYPKINGVLPDKAVDSMDMHVYKNVNIKVDYTGKLLLGRDFLSDYYIHMGLQWPWAYETLTEFVFEKGSLVEINDQSEMSKHLRDVISKEDGFLDYIDDQIIDHIPECFSDDYYVKAWWLLEGDFSIEELPLAGKGAEKSHTYISCTILNQRENLVRDLLRDAITTLEHPDSKWVDTHPTVSDIFKILERKNIDLDNIELIELCHFGNPSKGLDAFLSFCEELQAKKGLRISLQVFRVSDFSRLLPAIRKHSLKIDILGIDIPERADADCDNLCEMFKVESFENLCDFVSEMKKCVPDITVTLEKNYESDENIKRYEHIVEERLKVKFDYY